MAEQKKIVDKVIKGRSNASNVWKHFGFYEFNGKVDNTKAICKLCHASKPYTGGSTSNLNSHLNIFHSEIVSKGRDVPQKTIDTLFSKPKAMSKDSFEYKKMTRSVANFIVGELLPLSTVDKASFKAMVTDLNPRYEPPCASYLTSNVIPEMYAEIRSEIEKKLVDINFLACTTDGWTSAATQSYVTGMLYVR